jgi:cell division protein FtsL
VRAVTFDTMAMALPRTRRRPGLGALGLVVVVGWLALCTVLGAWVRLSVIQAGYDMSALRQERARLTDERRKLEIELAGLSAPGRIEAVASARLGLKVPAPEQVMRLP